MKQDLMDSFYAFGEVTEIKMMSERRCALVTFSMRKAAEEAAKGLYRKLSIKGSNLKMWWAKSQLTIDNEEAAQYCKSCNTAQSEYSQPPAPGMVAPGGAGNARMLYPSMNPNAMGARPDTR